MQLSPFTKNQMHTYSHLIPCKYTVFIHVIFIHVTQCSNCNCLSISLPAVISGTHADTDKYKLWRAYMEPQHKFIQLTKYDVADIAFNEKLLT